MKNRFLKLFMITTLTVYMLVGCGGTETGEDNGAGTNTEANVNSEADSDVSAKIDPSKYKEYEYYYGFLNEEDMDKTYVDGTSLTTSTWESVNMTIKIKESVNLYNPNKELVGLSKPNIDCTYILTNEDWSFVAFGTNFESNDTYPNGAAYVRNEELMTVVEVTGGGNINLIGDENETNSVEKEVTVEEMYVAIKTACDEAGLVYDESAFSSVNLTDFTTKSTPNGYAYMPFTMPIDNKDAAIPSFVEYLKDAIKIAQEDGFSGMNYILESVEIREPKYGEGSSKQYVFNLYLKFY